MELWEHSQEMRQHPAEMVFREYWVCESVVQLLNHEACFVRLALVQAPGKMMSLPLETVVFSISITSDYGYSS